MDDSVAQMDIKPKPLPQLSERSVIGNPNVSSKFIRLWRFAIWYHGGDMHFPKIENLPVCGRVVGDGV